MSITFGFWTGSPLPAANRLDLASEDYVADFLANGRKPQGVDSEHYLDLERLADKQCSRYAAYLDKLRNALAARK